MSTTPMTANGDITRNRGSVLSGLEKRLLVWMAERMPRPINSDHLTVLGLLGMFGAGLSFWAAGTDAGPRRRRLFPVPQLVRRQSRRHPRARAPEPTAEVRLLRRPRRRCVRSRGLSRGLGPALDACFIEGLPGRLLPGGDGRGRGDRHPSQFLLARTVDLGRPGSFWRSRWIARLARFNSTTGMISILGNVLFMKIFVGELGLHYLLGNVASIASCAVLNFLVSDRFVFLPLSPTAPR